MNANVVVLLVFLVQILIVCMFFGMFLFGYAANHGMDGFFSTIVIPVGIVLGLVDLLGWFYLVKNETVVAVTLMVCWPILSYVCSLVFTKRTDQFMVSGRFDAFVRMSPYMVVFTSVVGLGVLFTPTLLK